MALRDVVRIDEEKCDGCGQCVPACAEGAIQIVDGKAKLISDVYCDGLGACLGECPNDAITIERREAAEFDEEAAREHLAGRSAPEAPTACPGSAPRTIERCELVDLEGRPEGTAAVSRLGNWPVQLKLVPSSAPYFQDADLLFAADCVPFAYADFHGRFLQDKVLMIGCPKLDSADFYRQKPRPSREARNQEWRAARLPGQG